MKVLFVCNLGENRSRTAAHMFKDKYETKYAGVLDNLVTKEQMEWADVVVVMEEHQKRRLRAMFPDTNKKIINLDISDAYAFDNPKLKKLISQKMPDLAT